MGRFDPHGGYRKDIDVHAGLASHAVSAMITAVSRSDAAEYWESLANIYDGLNALGSYRWVATDSAGYPIDADFGMGEVW
ncbi:hypothetical protein [Streptomyces sp. NPDC053367]|uniref:hypothetical protein n=1 Tax=Streptomyces sp. NPDC053367 TaxID=3365700 RepID=UPI0037D54EF7